MELKNKLCLITGGARVGKFVATELAKADARVAMTYLNDESEVQRGTQGYQADMTQETSVRRLWKKIKSETGPVDALVNMVSLFLPDEEELTLNYVQKIFHVNAFGNMLISRLFAESSRERGCVSAPIVSFIDWAVDHPYDNYSVYLAAKAALRHYLMGLQTSFAGHIRVVNIHPGMILEPRGFPASEKITIIDNTPTRAIGTPEQAARLVRVALELDYLADNINFSGGQQWRHRL